MAASSSTDSESAGEDSDQETPAQQGQVAEQDVPAAADQEPEEERAERSDDTRPAPDFDASARRPSPRRGSPMPPPPSGPPQHWARAYRTPNVPGCDSGPYLVQFRNRSDNLYFEVYLDGRRLRVFGGGGELPHVPPGTSVYACLDSLGRHNVMGVAHHRRGRALTEEARFSLDITFQRRFRYASRQHQVVRLEQLID
jgi:hypothetical protein